MSKNIVNTIIILAIIYFISIIMYNIYIIKCIIVMHFTNICRSLYFHLHYFNQPQQASVWMVHILLSFFYIGESSNQKYQITPGHPVIIQLESFMPYFFYSATLLFFLLLSFTRDFFFFFNLWPKLKFIIEILNLSKFMIDLVENKTFHLSLQDEIQLYFQLGNRITIIDNLIIIWHKYIHQNIAINILTLVIKGNLEARRNNCIIFKSFSGCHIFNLRISVSLCIGGSVLS